MMLMTAMMMMMLGENEICMMSHLKAIFNEKNFFLFAQFIIFFEKQQVQQHKNCHGSAIF
jgi:hypothetical protein